MQNINNSGLIGEKLITREVLSAISDNKPILKEVQRLLVLSETKKSHEMTIGNQKFLSKLDFILGSVGIPKTIEKGISETKWYTTKGSLFWKKKKAVETKKSAKKLTFRERFILLNKEK